MGSVARRAVAALLAFASGCGGGGGAPQTPVASPAPLVDRDYVADAWSHYVRVRFGTDGVAKRYSRGRFTQRPRTMGRYSVNASGVVRIQWDAYDDHPSWTSEYQIVRGGTSLVPIAPGQDLDLPGLRLDLLPN